MSQQYAISRVKILLQSLHSDPGHETKVVDAGWFHNIVDRAVEYRDGTFGYHISLKKTMLVQ